MPTRLLPGSVGSFYVRVADVFIVLLYMWWLRTLKQKQSYKLSISTSMLCIIFTRLACYCCLSHKILNGIRQQNATLVDCLFSRDHFDCSVIYTWGTDKSCDWRSHRTANVARTPSRKWELNSNWLTAGKECGSIVGGSVAWRHRLCSRTIYMPPACLLLLKTESLDNAILELWLA